MSSIPVSYTNPNPIQVRLPSVKRSGQFSCMGWVYDPWYAASSTLIVLAVSDGQGEVVGSDAAIRYELLQQGADYRLQFSGSLSKLINKTVAVDINDKAWHHLAWICAGDGAMSFYVDAVYVPPEDGVGPDGVPYATAWSRVARRGGGNVWCPYLYEKGQAVTMFRWRQTSKMSISQAWVKDIMDSDRPHLPVITTAE